MADKIDFIDTKRTATKVRRALDYSGEMESGDSVASCIVTAKDAAGTDVSSSLIANPLPDLTGTKVTWTYLPYGTDGASYYVRVTATTAGGDVLPRVIRLGIEGL